METGIEQLDRTQTTSDVLVLDQPALPSYGRLHELMRRYQLKDLVNETAERFASRIDRMVGRRDGSMEGFVDPSRQDRWAVEFHWGHYHDFGEFTLQGRMGKHHMSMLAVFIDELQALPLSLDGLRILDVGCWTGGTSLLLAAMGAEVVAVEEIRKYAECVDYLRHAFKIDQLTVEARSLYDYKAPRFHDTFDIVLCAGVLHHLSDPKLALRILFNCLKNGGTCLLETAATDLDSLFELCTRSPKDLDANSPNSSGWNAMLFTPGKFEAMLGDVGFDVLQPSRPILHKTPEARLFSVARRTRHRDMRRSGLSAPHTR